jgi:perosamine synthetase
VFHFLELFMEFAAGDTGKGAKGAQTGKRAGSMGCFGTFSFHGTKTITTGEGGMFVTNDGDLYERVLTLSNHGRARGQNKQFWPDAIGFKYKISNLQAAIGCAQIDRVEELIARKRAIRSAAGGCVWKSPPTRCQRLGFPPANGSEIKR